MFRAILNQTLLLLFIDVVHFLENENIFIGLNSSVFARRQLAVIVCCCTSSVVLSKRSKVSIIKVFENEVVFSLFLCVKAVHNKSDTHRVNFRVICPT